MQCLYGTCVEDAETNLDHKMFSTDAITEVPTVMPTPPSTPSTPTLTLDQLRKGQSAVVAQVMPHVQEGGTDFSRRLMELGFVKGEAVTILAKGFWSGEPIAVRVGGSHGGSHGGTHGGRNSGGTTFALRRFEAAQISVVAASVVAD